MRKEGSAMEKGKFCPAMWFSGFFALGALVHLIRSVIGFDLIVGSHAVPVSLSIALAVVLGTLSVALLFISLKRPFCCGNTGSCK